MLFFLKVGEFLMFREMKTPFISNFQDGSKVNLVTGSSGRKNIEKYPSESYTDSDDNKENSNSDSSPSISKVIHLLQFLSCFHLLN